MNKILKLVSLATLCLMLGQSLLAQKYGYIDSQQLLVDHPAVKAADAELKGYTDQLMSKGTEMVQQFEAEYQKLLAEAENLAPVEIQNREAALGQQQQAIQAYEQDMQQKIGVKREGLYSPILATVKSTIEEIGEAEGYTMIFDTSTGFILHTDATSDLMVKVKGRLGI